MVAADKVTKVESESSWPPRGEEAGSCEPGVKVAAARLIGEPVEGTREARNRGDAEEHAADQVDDDSHQPEWPRSGSQPMRRGGAVGDQDQGKEANRAESVCRSRAHSGESLPGLWPGVFPDRRRSATVRGGPPRPVRAPAPRRRGRYLTRQFAASLSRQDHLRWPGSPVTSSAAITTSGRASITRVIVTQAGDMPNVRRDDVQVELS